jgi:hypothetical protein
VRVSVGEGERESMRERGWGGCMLQRQRERRPTDLTGLDGLDGCGRATHAHTSRPKEQREPVTSRQRASGQPAPATPPWPATPAATIRLQSLASGGPAEGCREGHPMAAHPPHRPPDARRQTRSSCMAAGGMRWECSHISSASRRSILPDDALTGLD